MCHSLPQSFFPHLNGLQYPLGLRSCPCLFSQCPVSAGLVSLSLIDSCWKPFWLGYRYMAWGWEALAQPLSFPPLNANRSPKQCAEFHPCWNLRLRPSIRGSNPEPGGSTGTSTCSPGPLDSQVNPPILLSTILLVTSL